MTRTDTRFLKWGDEQKHHPSRPLSTSTQIRLWRIQCARLVDPIAFAPSRHQHIRCLQREEDGETWGNEGNVVRISLVRVVGEYMSLVNGGRRRCAPHHSFPQGMQKYPWRLQKAEIMQILDPFPWGLLFFLYLFQFKLLGSVHT